MIERRWSELRVRDTVLVIIYGIFFPMMLGCLAGLADYFLQTGLRFTLSHVLLWVVAVFTGVQVRKQFLRPHIVYTVLTGIGIFMAGVIMIAFPTLYAAAIRMSDWTHLFDVGFYTGVAADMLNPLSWLQAFIRLDFPVIIRLLIFIVGIYLGINKTFR